MPVLAVNLSTKEMIMSSSICQLCLSEIPLEALICRYCGRIKTTIEQEYESLAVKKLKGSSFFIRHYSNENIDKVFGAIFGLFGGIIGLYVTAPWNSIWDILLILLFFGGFEVLWEFTFVFLDKYFFDPFYRKAVKKEVTKLRAKYQPSELLSHSREDQTTAALREIKASARILIVAVFLAITNPTPQEFTFQFREYRDTNFSRTNLAICSLFGVTTATSSAYYLGIAGNFLQVKHQVLQQAK